MDPKYQPTNLSLDMKQKELRITWRDAVETKLSFLELRRHCPCAVCNEAREKMESDPLFVLNNDMANATSELDPNHPAEKVGQYALQFFWADGHRTGIYTYPFLRNLADQS